MRLIVVYFSLKVQLSRVLAEEGALRYSFCLHLKSVVFFFGHFHCDINVTTHLLRYIMFIRRFIKELSIVVKRSVISNINQ